MVKITIDYKAAVPVYEQIKQALKMTIISGKAQYGEQAESVRSLSTQLKVSQNTVLKAYFQLDQEGFLESRPGIGYFVSWKEEGETDESRALFNQVLDDFLNRMAGLGYTPEDIIRVIRKKTGE